MVSVARPRAESSFALTLTPVAASTTATIPKDINRDITRMVEPLLGHVHIHITGVREMRGAARRVGHDHSKRRRRQLAL